jgi:2-oxoglutarate/2-oxoacid ferredoxin oxidoreductase subunit alpha
MVIQPEDEIAAINMVIGAACAGTRAMTVTSGSGFALMVEGIGLSGITETPAVIVLGQRPGPACGLPTRSEQGELLFALNAGTGEFPRAVLAPSSAQEAFYLMPKAFNLAEKYQIPVIVLTDTHLANSYVSLDQFDLSGIQIDRGQLIADSAGMPDYQRYQLTESGISPRALPGMGDALVCADADEHTPAGHLTEDPQIRRQQVLKRLNKYQSLSREIKAPLWEKQLEASLTLVGWGSTLGAIQEAAGLLRERGLAANILHFSEIWPFPSEFVSAALKDAAHPVVIENNATGQLAVLIRQQTGIETKDRISKFDGRPISASHILENLPQEFK